MQLKVEGQVAAVWLGEGGKVTHRVQGWSPGHLFGLPDEFVNL